jgi:hypothetical protein
LLIPILTATTIQLTFAWKFHATYINLHEKFSKTMQKSRERTNNRFGDSLFGFLRNIFGEIERRKLALSSISKEDIATFANREECLKGITELADILKAGQDEQNTYRNARENARSVYVLMLVSGGASLLGILRVTNVVSASSDPQNLLYWLFVLPLLLALLAWRGYHDGESKLVRLRDELM